jgi:DNA-binding NarL/FixJ family response regulator
MTFAYAHDAVVEVSVRVGVRRIFTKLHVADRAQAIAGCGRRALAGLG